MAPARACGLFIAAVCLLAGVDAGPLSAHRRLLAPPEASSPALPRGRVVSPAVYAANLKAIARDVLPRGWQLNAVQKWDAYGHGLPALAAAAAAGGFSVSVLSNREAREAYEANPRPPAIRRIMPAEGPVNYSVVAEALRRGWGVEELLSPLNEADVLRAARDAGTTIPVHIYLYNHYENDQYGYAFNASELLQAFVESLDPRLVSVRGIMMHTGGDTPEQAERLVKLFNEADQAEDFDIMDDVLLMADEGAEPDGSGGGGDDDGGGGGPAAGLDLDTFMGPGLLPGAATSELGAAFLDDVLGGGAGGGGGGEEQLADEELE